MSILSNIVDVAGFVPTHPSKLSAATKLHILQRLESYLILVAREANGLKSVVEWGVCFRKPLSEPRHYNDSFDMWRTTPEELPFILWPHFENEYRCETRIATLAKSQTQINFKQIPEKKRLQRYYVLYSPQYHLLC
jgi:hypothetical protein